MKKLIVSLFALYSGACCAQVIPPLYVPYIPIVKAKPVDAAAALARADAEGAAIYTTFKAEINKLFVSMVIGVDMLTVHKTAFQRDFDRTRSKQDVEMAINPASALYTSKLSEYGRAFDEFCLNAVQIQLAKTKYSRVLAWENHLRDKDLLDAPYKNAKGATSLSNRQALSILYGTNEDAYLQLAWE